MNGRIVGCIAVFCVVGCGGEISNSSETTSQDMASTAFEIDYYATSDFSLPPVGAYINRCNSVTRWGRTTRTYVRTTDDSCGSVLIESNCYVDGVPTFCPSNICQFQTCCQPTVIIYPDGSVADVCQ